MQIKAWMDNQEIVEVLKTLSNEVEAMKRQIADMKQTILEIKYKGQVD